MLEFGYIYVEIRFLCDMQLWNMNYISSELIYVGESKALYVQ